MLRSRTDRFEQKFSLCADWVKALVWAAIIPPCCLWLFDFFFACYHYVWWIKLNILGKVALRSRLVPPKLEVVAPLDSVLLGTSHMWNEIKLNTTKKNNNWRRTLSASFAVYHRPKPDATDLQISFIMSQVFAYTAIKEKKLFLVVLAFLFYSILSHLKKRNWIVIGHAWLGLVMLLMCVEQRKTRIRRSGLGAWLQCVPRLQRLVGHTPSVYLTNHLSRF